MHFGRTVAAAAVLLAGLGTLGAAWYVSGSRAARQEATLIARQPLGEALIEAERIAQRLAARLEGLRQSESRRPFADYLGHRHGQNDDCSCATRVSSPLAAGPVDPLVWAHFQIDEVGQLSLPTLAANPAVVPGAERELQRVQQAILDRLECAATERLSLLGDLPDATERQALGEREGLILVGPFEWHTVAVDDRPAFVALREVATPTAVLAQGFVVRHGAIETLLGNTAYPARVRAGAPSGATEARIPLEGEPWSVTLDASTALDAAAVAGRQVEARFRRSFAFGLLGAVLAGGLVVGLVAQADRLAWQRARFAAAAAHELRTPLAGLRLYSEMLADGSGDPLRGKAYARRIADEADRLGRVVGNVLEYTRLERGGSGVRCQPGDLGQAVSDSVERLRPALEACGAKIELSIQKPLRPARFDGDAVHQILQNLLDNAEKYSRRAPDRTVRIMLAAAREGPVLSVSDRGPGLSPAMRQRLFHPFARDVATDAPAGLGLGLALVRAMSQAQQARVAHADAEGGGSRFSITFRWA